MKFIIIFSSFCCYISPSFVACMAGIQSGGGGGGEGEVKFKFIAGLNV